MVLIGHSHVNAVAAAARADGSPIDIIAFWGEPGAISSVNGQYGFRPDLAHRVAAGRQVLSAIGGGAPSVLGLVEHPRPLDFVLPSAPDLPLDSARELVPVDGVSAALAALDSEYESILSLLLATATGPVLQLESPPPVVDNDRIRPFVPWGLFPNQPREITPPWVRYKIWRLYCEMTARRCGELGVRYVPAPRAAMDPDGFLRPGLDDDGIHAGAAYGRLVLQDLGLAA